MSALQLSLPGHPGGAAAISLEDAVATTDPIVVGYGMGVDSTALLIGLQQLKIRPHLILFANTGSEKPETYAYLPIINAWLDLVGFPRVTVLKRASPKAGDTSLHGECLRKSVLPSLAYGGHSCSLKWKVEPQWAYCKKVYGWTAARRRKGQLTAGSWAHGPFITKLIGYNAGPQDSRRVANAAGKWPPGHRYVYPLREWNWDRAACERTICDAGLPLPMKSACFMCPASKKTEVDWLQQFHPDLAATAMEMERRAHVRGLTTTVGLGRRWSWTAHLGNQSHAQGRNVAVPELPL
jgi:hypothetical protein